MTTHNTIRSGYKVIDPAEKTIQSINNLILQVVNDPNVKDDQLKKYLHATANDLSGYSGSILKDRLTARFGDCDWEISMSSYTKPAIFKNNDKRNVIRYVIKKLAWKAGPSMTEVHSYIAENMAFCLDKKEFDHNVYYRKQPFLTNRYVQTYAPTPFSNRKWKPIKININKLVHKVNEKEMKQFYQLEVMDRRLGAFNKDNTQKPLIFQGTSKEDVLIQFQGVIEEIFYTGNGTADNRIRYAALLRYENTPVNEYQSLDQLQHQLQQQQQHLLALYKDQYNGYSDSGGPMISALPSNMIITAATADAKDGPKSRAEKMAEEGEEQAAEEVKESKGGEREDEGGGERGMESSDGPTGTEISDTDGPDVSSDNTIPIEEPIVGEGGVPPSEESVEHNYHDDARPDLEDAARRESGGDGEETGDSVEASILDPNNQEEEEDEDSKPNKPGKPGKSSNVGYTISQLIEQEQEQQKELLHRILSSIPPS